LNGNTITAATFHLFPFSMPTMARAQNGSHGGYEFSLANTLLKSLNGKINIIEPDEGNWGYESPKGSGSFNGELHCLLNTFLYIL